MLLTSTLLALAPLQAATDVAEIRFPKPDVLAAYADDGVLLWTVRGPRGADWPPALDASNAYGLLDGTWQRDAYGNWFHEHEVAGGVAFGSVSPPCLPWEDPPGIVSFAPPAGTTQFDTGPTLHDPDGDAWVITETTGDIVSVRATESVGHTGAWNPASTISTGLQYDWPDQVVAPNGDITVAWRMIESGTYHLYTTRYTVAGGWEPNVLVHSSGAFIQYFDLAATDTNDVILGFAEGSVFGGGAAYAMIYDHALGTWGSPAVVSDPGVSATFPTVNASPDGSKAAFVYYDIDAQIGLYHHEYDPVTKSFGPSTVPQNGDKVVNGGFADATAEIAHTIDNDGHSTVVFLQDLTGAYHLLGSHYEDGSWEPFSFNLAPLVGGLIGMTLEYNTIALTESGDVVGTCVALQAGMSDYTLFAFRYGDGNGWKSKGLAQITIEPFTFVSLSHTVAYSGDRAYALTNDNTVLFGHHYNGVEWGAEVHPGPVVDVGATLSAGGGDALLIDVNSQVESRWLQGTTAFANMGGGLDGALGVPSLSAYCDQVVGEDVTFLLENAFPNAPVIITLGTSVASLPFFGGTLVPSPDFLISAATDATGTLEVTLPWPNGVGSGFTFYYQDLVVDALAAEGIAMSNALAGTTP